MTPSQKQRVREIFMEASEAPTAERSVLLSRLCGGDAPVRDRVLALLEEDDRARDGADGFLGDLVLGCLADLELQASQEGAIHRGEGVVGDGAYRILRCIGVGGMGAVYEAMQRSPERRVALKLLRPALGRSGAELTRRFRHEAQILGSLDHPGVARIYESGCGPIEFADGSRFVAPYFVMEYVAGEPVTVFARNRALGRRATIELLISVCEAVEHAHQKGVIHRDLKPANILVTDAGQPKVLDFGIARLISEAPESSLHAASVHTATGVIVGTLGYMAPEQGRGDAAAIDTRSDVYALGVIGYELLAGRLPIEVAGKSLTEAVAAVNGQRPSRLGAVDPALRGDLEACVGKALEKEPARRYSSAAELANDLRRHLRDEPIDARHASAFYVLRKFARRNRSLVGLASLAVVAVMAGVIGVGAFALAAERSARESRRQGALAAEGADLLFQQVIQELPRIAGSTPLQRRIVEAAAAHYEKLLAESPADAASRVRMALSFEYLSRAYRQLSRPEEARRAAEQFLRLARANLQLAPGEPDRVHDVARAHLELDRSSSERHTPDLAAGIELAEQLVRAEPGNIAYLDTLGHALVDQIRVAHSEPHVRAGEILDRMRAVAPGDERTLMLSARVNDHTANAHLRDSEFEQAATLLTAMVSDQRRLLQDNPADPRARAALCIFLSKLSEANRGRGDDAAWRAALREASDESGLLERAEPTNVYFAGLHSDILAELGECAMKQGDFAEACRLFDGSLQRTRRYLATLPKQHAYVHTQLVARWCRLVAGAIRDTGEESMGRVRRSLAEVRVTLTALDPYRENACEMIALGVQESLDSELDRASVRPARAREVAAFALGEIRESELSGRMRARLEFWASR